MECRRLDCSEPGVEFVSLFVFAFPGPDGVQLIMNLIFDVLGSCLSYCCAVLFCVSATTDHLMVGGCEKEVKIFIKHVFSGLTFCMSRSEPLI